jgi:hypothetical protein
MGRNYAKGPSFLTGSAATFFAGNARVISPSWPARIPQHSRCGWRPACFRSCPYTLRRLRTARFISRVCDKAKS